MYDTYDNDFDKAFDEAVDRLDRQQNWRPIYAEKLKAHYSWWKGGTGTMTYDEAKETFDTIIDLQPTVEPKHGRWETPKGYPNVLLCSECNTPYEKKEFMATPNYCPNCGCMMDEVEPTRYDTTFGDGSPVTLTDV